ncbi:MAG: NF038122 family metalloprotease, partial [Betaproteobacteria bacterium]|nr:NF038122 family metalloprotease [Betaproteobacteria bacterium]
MQINLSWDSSVTAAPSNFKTDIQIAASQLDAAILDPITVTIQVGWWENGGHTLTGGASGSFQDVIGTTDVSQVAQWNNQIIAALSTQLSKNQVGFSTPTNTNYTSPLDYSTTQAKALGLSYTNNSNIDGSVGFAFTNTSSANADANMIAAALHELTHALGRIDGFTTMALFTYSAPGQLWNPGSSTPGYFSLDGGITNLGTYSSADFADFTTLTDPFSSANSSLVDALTPLDRQALQALGFNVAPVTSYTVSSFLAHYAANPGMTLATISDTSANIIANLDALEPDVSGIGVIAMTDAAKVLTVTANQYWTDTYAIEKITGSYTLALTNFPAYDVGPSYGTDSTISSIAVSDSAANIASSLDQLQALGSKLVSVTITDPANPLSISATQVTNDAGALADISGNYSLAVSGVTATNLNTVLSNSHVSPVSITDTNADFIANLNTLNGDVSRISSVTLTDSSVLVMTSAQQA